MADCQYVTKEYANAVSTYQELLQSGSSNKDYIYFQLGLVNSLQSNNEEAKSYYQKVIDGYPSSKYIDNSILQLAEIYFEGGEYQASIVGFSNLIDNYKQSPLVPFALVKRALAYSNQGEYDLSESDYKKVLDNYISHPTANGALLGLQELSAKNSVSDFNTYLSKYQQANPDDESLETVEFEAAKTLYFNQVYSKAIEGFKQFQERYANSSQLNEANYYIADSYFRSRQKREAIPYLRLVVVDDQNTYQTRSLDRLATLLAEQGETTEAIDFFRVLEKKARNRRELGNAWEGIMSVYFNTTSYDSAIQYANKILGREKLSPDLKSKATLVSAKVKFEKKEYTEAEDLYLALINGVKDEVAAEANYELGKLYFETGRYKTSLQTLFELNKSFAQYDQWLGKSFLLIADNYLEQDELFQAKATLNSIIENAENEQLKELALEKLSKLDKLEKAVVLEQDSSSVVDTLSNTENNNE